MEINLPDLEEVICKAIPHEPKDCHLMRDVRLQRRKWLETRIREYAEIYHLHRLSQNEPI